jgi:iron complex transport system substrate-binding protein
MKSGKKISFSLVWLVLVSLVVSACGNATISPTPTTAIVPTQAATPGQTAAPTATAEAVAPKTNLTNGCVTNYDAKVDYFPEKTTFKYSSGLKLEYFKNYKVVTLLTPWRGAKETFQYVLVQCGTPAPKGYEKATTIEVPVKTVVTTSTTQLPFLDQLGLLDRLIGHDDLDAIYLPNVRKLVDAGKLTQVSREGKINIEAVLNLKPDLVMTFSVGSPEYDSYPKLTEAGLKATLNADHMENSPLGRSEWLKHMSLFFNKEATAEKLFADIVTRYESLTAKAKSLSTKPTVVTGYTFKGTWNVSGGESYFARFLQDAGANYLWADQKAVGSIPLSFEAVYDKAVNADFWINGSSFWKNMDDLLKDDERNGSFAAFKNQKIYNNNGRVSEKGGNDYFQSGIANPDVVLADLIKILHPELLPDHKLVYYQQLQFKK